MFVGSICMFLLENVLLLSNRSLFALANKKRREIGDDLTNVIGLENREIGMID